MRASTNLHSSQFLKINYCPSKLLLEIVWQPGSRQMNQEDYQKYFYTYVDIRRNYKIDKVLLDESLMFFAPDPNLQSWASNLINTNLHIKPKQIAVVMSDEFIKQLLVQLLIEEVSHDNQEHVFFTEKQDALQWLNDNILMDGYQLST